MYQRQQIQESFPSGSRNTQLSFMEEPLVHACSTSTCATLNSSQQEQQEYCARMQSPPGHPASIASSRVGPSVSHPPSIASSRGGQSVPHPASIASTRVSQNPAPSVASGRGSQSPPPSIASGRTSQHPTASVASGRTAQNTTGSIASGRSSRPQSIYSRQTSVSRQSGSSGCRTGSAYATIQEQDYSMPPVAQCCEGSLLRSQLPECCLYQEQPTRDSDSCQLSNSTRVNGAACMTATDYNYFRANIMGAPEGDTTVCLPCGHKFQDSPKDTCWRVKIMKDVGMTTKGFLENAVQTQTSETRIINADKLESLLPDSERFFGVTSDADLECEACKASSKTFPEASRISFFKTSPEASSEPLSPTEVTTTKRMSIKDVPPSPTEPITECGCPVGKCRCQEVYSKKSATSFVTCGAPPDVCRKNRKKRPGMLQSIMPCCTM